MRLASLVIFLSLLHIQGSSDTIYVPDDFTAIQDAISAASQGDTVIVRPGTYPENLDFNGKAITVTSELGPFVTVVDGRRAGRVVSFENGEGLDSVINGFSLTNGKAPIGLWGYYCGGGIGCWYESSPTITNNIIFNNEAIHYGGGIFCYDRSSPIISNNIIEENSGQKGGGIFLDSHCAAEITRNTIRDNAVVDFGGGIYCWLSDARIADNTVTSNTATYQAGGIMCNSSSPTIENNEISLNAATAPIAGWGGGIVFVDAYPVIANNIIARNWADKGGGIYGNYASITITNNTIVDNTAAHGGGIYFAYASATVTNTVLSGNAAAEGPEVWLGFSTYPSTIDMSYSDLEGGQGSVFVDPGSALNLGAGMIDADPLLVDRAGGDCHLTWDSPCRNAGDDAAPGLPTSDFEGDPRGLLGAADIGADEYHYHLYGVGDPVPGGAVELKIVGYPAAPAMIAFDREIMGAPLPTIHGDFYLPWPPLWYGWIGSVPGNGVLAVTATIPAGWNAGEECFLQGLAGPWGGPLTRLTNPMALVVE